MPTSLPPKRIDLRLAVVAVAVWVIRAIMTVSREGVRTHEAAASLAPEWWRAAFESVATRLPGLGGQLMPGLVLGDTSRVTEELDAAMKTASLTHLTAVSGANCAVVVASAMALAAVLRCPRWLRALAGIFALAGFVAVVGLQPSVVRAAAMAVVVIVATVSGRPGSGVPVLALAVLILLLWKPEWSVSPGFVLSVAATAALVTLAPALATRWAPRLGRTWATLLAVPLAAQLVCQPIIVLLAPSWPTFGVVANVLADPLAPLATVVGMIAFVAVPICPPLALGLAWVAWLPAQAIGVIATLTASAPFASLPWLAGWWGFATCALASAAAVVVMLTPSVAWRRGGAVIVVATLGLSLSVALATSVRSAFTRPTNWTIAACDVGQGDGLLIRGTDDAGGTHVVLVDTGRHPEKLRSCLRSLDIRRVDAMVLTHFDMDHAGGVEASYGHAARAIISAPQRPEDQWIVLDMAAHGVTVERARAGMRLDAGSTRIDVLWPRPDVPDMQGGNPGSVSLLIHAPGLTAAFLADLGRDAQERLLASYPELPAVDVLKVAHHGSADQSPRLIARLHPREALISVGRDNGYGHPTATTLGILESLGTRIDRTDHQGMILISVDDSRLTVWSERADSGAG